MATEAELRDRFMYLENLRLSQIDKLITPLSLSKRTRQRREDVVASCITRDSTSVQDAPDREGAAKIGDVQAVDVTHKICEEPPSVVIPRVGQLRLTIPT